MKIDRIQRAATKMVPSLRDLPYEEKLSRLKLPTLEKRRERGDFIAVYRASKGLEKIERRFVCVGRQKYKSTKEYKGRTDSNSLTGPNEVMCLATLLL